MDTFPRARRLVLALALSAAALALPATGLAGGAPHGVYFVAPEDGATVGREFEVVMGVRGMRVHPAGSVIPGTGHHHLIIDGDPVPVNGVVPKDATHRHFGGGQTRTTLRLEPGWHRLTLQFADGLHRSFGENMSATIRVRVAGNP